MKRTLAITLLACAPAAQAVMPAAPAPAWREGEVLVKFRHLAGDADAAQLRAELGLTPLRTFLGGRVQRLALPRVTTTQAVLDLLRTHPAVAHAEPNALRAPRERVAPSDPLFGEQWGLHSTGQPNYLSPDPALASIPGADLDMLAAWDADADGVFERVGDATVTIAVVDDSVDVDHPDLAPNVVGGFDFVHNDPDPRPDAGSEQFHGTLVAGAAAAVGNDAIGVAGTAWHARLMPLKFGFDTASHIAALEFARDNGADIVNASFGGPMFSQLELDVIQDLAAHDILYVAAAGNDDSNTDVARLNYPANHDAPNIVSVVATNRQDGVASFSQYGPITTDVAAPGLQIVSTANGGSWSTNPGISGTSFASPYTAGIAALIRSVHAAADFREVKARLIEGAEPGANVRQRTAGGRVNAARSLDLAPRPSLVIRSFELVDANGALDPGESLAIDVTIENLWLDAAGVTGTLSANDGVTVTSGAVSFGAVPRGSTATGRFDVSVDSGTGHRYVVFTLALADGDGYAAERSFIAEVARLEDGRTAKATFVGSGTDLYDEFHAWHYDFAGLPSGHDELVFETTSSATDLPSPDIDLLVRRDAPPVYTITVGTNPESPQGFYCTSATEPNCLDPDTLTSAGANGDEQVVIRDPAPGTYHFVIVNFAQLGHPLNYTLKAYTRASPGEDGGALPPLALAALLAAALARRRRT